MAATRPIRLLLLVFLFAPLRLLAWLRDFGKRVGFAQRTIAESCLPLAVWDEARWESRHDGYGNPASSLCHLIYVTTEGVPRDMAVTFEMNEKYFYKTLDKDTVRWLNSCPK